MRCSSVDTQLRAHVGYPARDTDVADMHALARHFGCVLPAPYASGPVPNALEAALDTYRTVSAEEAEHVRRIRDALRAVDVLSRAAPLHVTASALVVDSASRRVLLRRHEAMGQWMQVGGHFDPGESDPWEVTRREAREETGLGDLALVGTRADGPVQIVIVPVGRGATSPRTSTPICASCSPPAIRTVARPESPTAPLRWIPLASARGEVTEENLAVFLDRTRSLCS